MKNLQEYFDTEWFPQGIYFLCVSILFLIVQIQLNHSSALTFLILSSVVVVCGFSIGLNQLPGSFVILSRSITVVALFYIAAASPSVAKFYQGQLHELEWFLLFDGRYIVLILGAVGFWRPAFNIYPLLYILWQQPVLSQLFDFSITDTDSAPVIDFGLFLICGLVSIQIITRFFRNSKYVFPWKRLLEIVVLIAIATHFANYFYSAIKKMVLDDNPLSWALYNNTHYIVMASDISHMMPLAFSEASADLTHALLLKIVPVMNWGIMLIQLSALVALWRRNWAIVITLLFDLTHVVIFLVTGILFWKWMLLNLAIVAALITLKRPLASYRLALFLSVCTLGAPSIFNTLPLGWWDTTTFNRSYFTAVTLEGDEMEVPSNYFLSGSKSVAQQKRVGTPYVGHYSPNNAIGAYYKKGVNRMRKVNTCDRKLGEKSEMMPEVYESLKQYVRNQHAYILENINYEGIIYYDLYPHHIWSVPSHFQAFFALDKRKIQSYVFHIQSGCTKYEGRKVLYDIKLERTYKIEL